MAAAGNSLGPNKLCAASPSSNENDLIEVFEKLENIHYPAGPIYQSVQKLKALSLIETNELQAIYHLSESHTPGLRYRTVYRYERALTNLPDDKQLTLNKQYVDFSCRSEDVNVSINKMLKQAEEMPKEWTIVQLTPQFYRNENLEFGPSKNNTNPVHIAVFSCGKNQAKPFCVTVDAPIDKVSGNLIEIKQELASIIHENKHGLYDVKTSNGLFQSYKDKEIYSKKRSSLNNRMKLLVKDIQDIWLKEWRCLFIGKFVDESVFNEKLRFLLKELKGYEITEKTRCILMSLLKASASLKPEEIRNALQYCFPNKTMNFIWIVNHIKNAGRDQHIHRKRRHPVILAIDEKLDDIPWEMLDVLQDHPVSRMPSFHFTYALFKEYEDSIVDGIKADVDVEKGKFIINPSLDLKNMQARMYSFFNYWRPDWTGMVGVTPSSKEFESLLTDSDIFAYNGHGSGSQFLSGDKIQKLRINAVVLLFGCGSVKYMDLGPRVEMYGSYQTYLIACSPCVVGMLWEVTDRDTDLLASEFWSQWLPTSAPTHWKLIDKDWWSMSGEVVPLSKKSTKEMPVNEPELLRALSKARKAARQYLTQAACVARGIPVKVK